MREELYKIFQNLSDDNLSKDQLVWQIVGFLTGISFALKDPALATTVTAMNQAEWILAGQGAKFGPDEMADDLLKKIRPLVITK